ncbi:NAD(P)/FAD-dependent oxidoreductase [Henriciella barbarensis]|uniref:NAD(P)/FAD-dependent oxidoreductase n=1 Tax=Henriciella barbarensis TaxID=86342 RepID=A0A399R2T6_9PROT|nr:NAD(P)/FAD-dependent oxidoreductase [Henriciella barbarensis]RIJ25806.1 NAD(P)/FAD-dependent oxidoreductase [Henriciella barbarensis]
METLEADLVVIGAGVIGLAVARACAQKRRDVIVLEAEDLIASHTSSRNSEVIHAGLYYPKGSLKARFCVEGRRKLYAYLDDHGVEHKNCGKLVVAHPDEENQLSDILARARDNDVEDLKIISGVKARRLEPALSGDIAAAIHSPVSGIFDSHGYFLALQGELEDAGGMIAFGTPVTEGSRTPGGVELITGGATPSKITARTVINCAGHRSIELARLIDADIDLPEPHYVKGSYFSILGKTPFSRLIYPMPGRASLGLHLTVDLAGRGKLGPDAEWLPDDARPPFDYQVDPARAPLFYESARRYWPGLPEGALTPDYAGVRPKIVEKGAPSGDFMIRKESEHLIHLIGIESPGLTSSLAIADHVAGLLD